MSSLKPNISTFRALISFKFQMRLVILDDYDNVSLWAAKYIRRRIIDFDPGPNKYFTLGLPTGMLMLFKAE